MAFNPSTCADDTPNDFFQVLDPSNTTNEYQNLNDLMTLFCPDNADRTLPWIGISKYGPQFQGTSAVRNLFRQLFVTFPDGALAEVDPTHRFYYPRGVAAVAITGIATPTALSGTQTALWFQTPPYYSPPISNITPDGKHSMSVDACAVVAFDPNSHKITQLALYFDRYSMSEQLTPTKPTPGN